VLALPNLPEEKGFRDAGWKLGRGREGGREMRWEEGFREKAREEGRLGAHDKIEMPRDPQAGGGTIAKSLKVSGAVCYSIQLLDSCE
jgi:hypothetical protein